MSCKSDSRNDTVKFFLRSTHLYNLDWGTARSTWTTFYIHGMHRARALQEKYGCLEKLPNGERQD